MGRRFGSGVLEHVDRQAQLVNRSIGSGALEDTVNERAQHADRSFGSDALKDIVDKQRWRGLVKGTGAGKNSGSGMLGPIFIERVRDGGIGEDRSVDSGAFEDVVDDQVQGSLVWGRDMLGCTVSERV